MAGYISPKEIEALTTTEYVSEQTNPGRRYKPYAVTAGLKEIMDYVEPEQIQELTANREFSLQAESIEDIVESDVSDIVRGQNTQGRSFEIEFNRQDHETFPWSEVKNLLGRQSTLYDVPVRHIVIRFNDTDFESNWKSYIKDAIDASNFSTSWIEPPFFAVLKSKKAGETDAREAVRDMHEDFYFDPKSRATRREEGFPWSLITLDLEGIWSYRAFIDDSEEIVGNWIGSQDWTPRKIERALMNYFNSDTRYSGRLRNSGLSNDWRRLFSLEATSLKVFEWEEDEEWAQQPDAEPEL
jgi:hypothetical protein